MLLCAGHRDTHRGRWMIYVVEHIRCLRTAVGATGTPLPPEIAYAASVVTIASESLPTAAAIVLFAVRCVVIVRMVRGHYK